LGVISSLNSLKSVFQSIQPDSCPYHYNFHLHTVCSDGQLRPEALLQQALTYGLKGLAITDHHTVAGYKSARRWLDLWNMQSSPTITSITLWPGIEITAQLLGVDVHILGYDFDPLHPTLCPYTTGKSVQGEAAAAAAVIQAIQQAGGLAILAHPVRYKRSPIELIPEASRLGIDGVETYYCYANSDPWSSSPAQTRMVKDLAETCDLLQTCGTDSHGVSILKRI
jgi:predicted metal-dependent phosphoesterase TrpH